MVNELAKLQLAPTVNRREPWRSEIETQRHAIYRDCPRDLVIDEGHALARVGGTMCGGAGAPMARRYLIKGLRADGFAESDIARALAASPDEMRRALGKLPIHEPGARKLRDLLARVVSPGDDALLLARSRPNTEERQGTIVRGSRGWRTPSDGVPQDQHTPP